MAFINSFVLILALLPGAAPTDVVPVITSAATDGTFGANFGPTVEGTAVVTVGITSSG